MQFPFYPKHEYGCPQVGHCPHVGGAALGTLVDAASDHDQYLQMLHGQLTNERERSARLGLQVESLTRRCEELQRELRAERQNKFAVNHSSPDPSVAPEAQTPATAKNAGAPVGHPGWFRRQPTQYDRTVDVSAPARCPHCQSEEIRIFADSALDEHIQEDLVDGRLQVVCYRHPKARCRHCRQWVRQPGDSELLGSMIGPHARAMATFLHNAIGVSLRKVPQAVAGLTGLRFTPAAVLGFEIKLAAKAKPLVADITKKIQSTDGAVHADETYWRLNGRRAYFWTHGTEQYNLFQFSMTRKGQVSRDVLGEYFAGVLVTDCYGGYDAQKARAKQKCLAHLARTARDWQKLVLKDSQAWRFFEQIKEWVKRGCRWHRRRHQLTTAESAKDVAWLRDELPRLESCPLDHAKARRLQARLQRYHDDWLVFVVYPGVSPTNNLAERRLRPLVILRKITYGHRSSAGAERMAALMTVQETAKCHRRRVLDFYYELNLLPPDHALQRLYSGP